jgi:hypothetical protein
VLAARRSSTTWTLHTAVHCAPPEIAGAHGSGNVARSVAAAGAECTARALRSAVSKSVTAAACANTGLYIAQTMSTAQVIGSVWACDGTVNATPPIITSAQPIPKRPITAEAVTEADMIYATWTYVATVLTVRAVYTTRAASKTYIARRIAVILGALACAIQARAVATAHSIVCSRAGCLARWTAPPL